MGTSELLHQTNLFNALSRDEFDRLVEVVELIEHKAGELVVREGDVGEELFVIATGTAQVVTRGRTGEEVILARLEAGQYFGEQSLLPGRPDERNASVRAWSDMRLVRVSKSDFQRALERDNPLKERLVDVGEEQLRQNLVKQSVLFRSLRIQGDEAWHATRTFADGEIIFQEGSEADDFYFILKGTAGVYRDQGGAPRLVVRLREGQCFGELALIDKTPRAATVIAEGPLELLIVDGDRFLQLYDEGPELRQYMQTLRKVYLLPGRGFTTQHTGRFLDMDAITTMYHLTGGRTVMASRVVGQDIYTMSLVEDDDSEATIHRYAAPEEGIERELISRGGHLVGLTSRGPWDELGEAHRMALERAPLPAWQASVFEEKGSLRLEAEATFFEDDEVVCACMQVSRGTLRCAIERGCRTARELSDATGAGTVCGACVPRLKELTGHEDWTPVRVASVCDLGVGIRSFRFEPHAGTMTPPQPGQHIVVQAQIEGNWVQRAYTLTSPSTATDHYEITVKREPHGIFSRWLFDHRQPDDLIRVSSPQGNVTYDFGETRPVVCIVGGIGVTPALAAARSFTSAGQGPRLHIDYSASTAVTAACLSELTGLAEANPAISFEHRITSKDRRIDPEQVQRLCERFPDALFYLCGPTGFLQSVRAYLMAAGVEDGRIRIEEFTPAGAMPKVKGVAPVPELAEEPVISIEQRGPQTPEQEARAYLEEFYAAKGVPQAFGPRWSQVQAELAETGTYVQTYDELAYGCKLAWRNTTRCIGRLYWQGLQVRDRREVTDEAAMFEEIVEHVRLAQNGGNLRSIMTVFAPRRPGDEGSRIWNPQVLRYAGYRQPDGSVLGDPGNVLLTDHALELGWEPKQRTRFDLLPIIIKHPGREPRLFELPDDLALEVDLEHPDFPWFAELGLKWYGLPMVANMLLDVGGVQYTCGPFNGWYMGTEIGARNFTDRERYDMLPTVAHRMGLDTRRDRDLWKDRALVEMNIAVLHSFEKAGIKMVDHHSASRDFMEFAGQERAARRPVFARWSWIIPPISGSVTDVFHVEWEEAVLKPNYFYQPEGWEQREHFERQRKLSV